LRTTLLALPALNSAKKAHSAFFSIAEVNQIAGVLSGSSPLVLLTLCLPVGRPDLRSATDNRFIVVRNLFQLD